MSQVIMRRYGKRPARAGAIRLRFGDFFDASALPKPPLVFGHYKPVDAFHMLGNDQYGDCVWAGAAHETMIWSIEGSKPRARFTTADVLGDYAAVTGFNPAKPDTDQGTDVQQAADYRRKVGILDAAGKRHKVDAYVSLRPGDVNELALAMWLFGAAGIGIEVPSTAQDQFDADQVWTVPTDPQIEGGHYIPGVGRDADGNILVVTWGQVQRMSPAFYSRFCDEAVAYLSLETLNAKNLTPEGYDAAGLRKALASLGGASARQAA